MFFLSFSLSLCFILLLLSSLCLLPYFSLTIIFLVFIFIYFYCEIWSFLLLFIITIKRSYLFYHRLFPPLFFLPSSLLFPSKSTLSLCLFFLIFFFLTINFLQLLEALNKAWKAKRKYGQELQRLSWFYIRRKLGGNWHKMFVRSFSMFLLVFVMVKHFKIAVKWKAMKIVTVNRNILNNRNNIIHCVYCPLCAVLFCSTFKLNNRFWKLFDSLLREKFFPS